MNQSSAEFTVNESRNPNYNFSPDEETALKKSQEERFAALKEQQAQRIAQRADEVRLSRALNQETIKGFFSVFKLLSHKSDPTKLLNTRIELRSLSCC
jgi:hypothetical protein